MPCCLSTAAIGWGSLPAAAADASQHRPSRNKANNFHAGGRLISGTLLPPLGDHFAHPGIDEVSVGTMHIQPLVIAKVIENSTVAIGNEFDNTQFEHRLEIVAQSRFQGREVGLGPHVDPVTDIEGV